MILIINLSTKFSTPHSKLSFKKNALAFKGKRRRVLIKAHLRFG